MAIDGAYRFATCRLLGHAWLVVPSDWDPRFGLPMTTRCERCDIERRDEVNRNSGDVESRRYVYPEGYLFSRSVDDLDWEAPRRSDFRKNWLDDQIAQQRARQDRNERRRRA